MAGRRDELEAALRSALAAAQRGLDPLDRLDDIPLIEDVIAGLTDEHVSAARDDGATWSTIAERLGVTRQAAHKRFGPARKLELRLELRRDR